MNICIVVSSLLLAASIPVHAKQEWYDRLWAETSKTGITMKRCHRRSQVPEDGSSCSWKPKACYFGTQTCSDGIAHPVTKCECSGGFRQGTWRCTDYTCPSSTAKRSGSSSVVLQAPALGTSASATLASVGTAIRKTIMDNPDVAAAYVRLGFHDCVPNGPEGGGCDGCINLDNPFNTGLDQVLDILAPITEMYESEEVSRADIWAYAAMVASDATQTELDFTNDFRIGRYNCEIRGTCSVTDPSACSRQGPDDDTMFPDAALSIHEILDFFVKHFGMSTQQTVALLGAHTLGTAHRKNSGYNGPHGWVINNTHLDNDFFVQLITSDYVEVVIDNSDILEFHDHDEFQWEQNVTDSNGELKTLLMLASDIALVRDVTQLPEGQKACTFNTPVATKCPLSAKTLGYVEAYAADNLLWLRDFKEAMVIMLEKFPF